MSIARSVSRRQRAWKAARKAPDGVALLRFLMKEVHDQIYHDMYDSEGIVARHGLKLDHTKTREELDVQFRDLVKYGVLEPMVWTGTNPDGEDAFNFGYRPTDDARPEAPILCGNAGPDGGAGFSTQATQPGWGQVDRTFWLTEVATG